MVAAGLASVGITKDRVQRVATAVGEDVVATAPSLIQQAANFTASAARHVASGLRHATDEEVERRYAICQTCEFLRGGACTKCGCGVSRQRKFLSKLHWANERCPIGKWGPAG